MWEGVLTTKLSLSLSLSTHPQRAMQAHKSQYNWFRKLYVTFSRYMIVNTYKSLAISG